VLLLLLLRAFGGWLAQVGKGGRFLGVDSSRESLERFGDLSRLLFSVGMKEADVLGVS